MISEYNDKKVLIFGLGLNQGGVGSAKFFASHGAKVRVIDQKSAEILKSSIQELNQFPDIEYTLGEHKNEDIDWADLIIKNPAVKPGNPYIEYAKKQGKTVDSDMGIFLNYIKPSQIIGVTGTKGKSTTASLIYEVFKSIGKDVVLAGNIGTSVLDVIPNLKDNSLIILEISSFQLEAFESHKVSPKWAVITNITPDHLNHYSSMKEYIEAKKIIGKYQNKDDFLFIKKNDPITTNSEFLNKFKGQIIFFSKDDLPKDLPAGRQGFLPILKGKHNLENIAAALAITKTFGIDEKNTLEELSKFSGVPFRMQKIIEWNKISIINDTTATSPEAGIKAIETYPSCILICGGMNKKMDYTKFAQTVDQSVKSIFFLEGDATDAIVSSLRAMRSNLPTQDPYSNLEKLLSDVKAIALPGDTILFSPAATSFNLFQNEFDRGKKFNKAVEKVFS